MLKQLTITMKKIFLLVVLLVAFTSCEEDIKLNNPSLQVMKDDVLLRTVHPQVLQNIDGSITIIGEYGFETLSLTVASRNPGTYKFGVDNTNIAYYKYDEDGLVLEYSTIEGIDNPELEDDLGELIIYPATHPKASPIEGTISGEFKFRGKILHDSTLGEPNIFFHQGTFYNLVVELP